MYKVYWTDGNTAQGIYTSSLTGALRICEEKRQKGMTFVTIASENPDSVGRPGVDAVVDGILPDGTDYTWKKRR